MPSLLLIKIARLLIQLLGLTTGLLLMSSVSASETIRYPISASTTPGDQAYPIALLKLLIDKSDAHADLQEVKTTLNKTRQFKALQDGKMIDVFWGGATLEREASLLPVRICILRGLMGWRIPLVTQKNRDLFAQTRSVDDLKKFTAGQGYQWSDTKVLLAAGIKVERTFDYEPLLRMLMANRFDYFPRSLLEIWAEQDAHKNMDIVVDSHIAIHYPAAFYFYVNKNNTALAETLRRGFELAIKDGSFNKIFYDFHKADILKAKLDTRTVIEIPSVLLPPGAPLQRKELWFSVDDLKKMSEPIPSHH